MKRKLFIILASSIWACACFADNVFVTNDSTHAVPISGTISASAGGAANVANSQVATSTTAATLAIARATRVGLLIRNLDTSISVYIGKATVTSSNGMLLKAGESVVVTNVGLWQVIAASGTPTVAIVDEYN